MNQPDKRLLKLLPYSISYLTMEQRDLPYNMQHVSGIDDIQTSIIKVISENSNTDELLSDLARTISDLFAADACLIISTTAEKNPLSKIGIEQKEPFILSQETIQQLSVLLSAHCDLDLTVERSQFSPIENLLQKILPNRTWIGITTQFQHQTNGLVLLLNRSEPWTDSQEKLLKQNSDLMAIAIYHAQLKQQTQTKTKYQTLLKNISREIGQVYQPQLLYQKCLREICTALGIDRGAILMLKYRNPLKAKGRKQQAVKGTVQIAARWKVDNNSKSASSFSLDNSKLCQQAWRNAPSPLYFESDTPFVELTSDETPSGSALLMMPLMGKKTSKTDPAMILGFLVFQHDSVYHWSEDEIDLIDWVSVQISTAIVHHQTLNQVQSIVDEKTAQLTSSLNFQAKLSAKMRDHIKQLQQVNQLKDDFMNSMSHELKTPLTSMKMAIKMLRQTESPQMRDRYLDILEQEWNREYSLIKDLLALQQLESGEITYSPQELNLTQTIASIAQSFKEKWQGEDLNLEIECQSDLKIHTDAESLENILNELLSNAGKYSDPHTTIKLSVVQAALNHSEIVISIANVGVRISPEELPFIFDKFRRGKGVTDRAVPGTGLGLALVQYFVEHLNGKIEVKSEPLDDESAFLTTFVLRLPQIQPTIS